MDNLAVLNLDKYNELVKMNKYEDAWTRVLH